MAEEADLAEEGLLRQGRVIDIISMEVACMFVKHCPDPELSCRFKCKPVDEWNARDIQRQLDDYQREKKSTIETVVFISVTLLLSFSAMTNH